MKKIQDSQKQDMLLVEKSRKSRLKQLWMTAAIVIVLIAAFAGLNTLFSAVEDRFGIQGDLTENAAFELSGQTKQVLDKLNEPVNLYTFFRTGQNNRADVKLLKRVSGVLAKYREYSPNIEVQNIDPQQNPTFSQQFDPEGKGIGENAVIVTNRDKSRFKVVSSGELFVWDENNNPIGLAAEQKMTSAIYYIETGLSSRARFLQGHYEPRLTEIGSLLQAMQLANAEAGEYNLLTDGGKLDPRSDILVIVSPKRDLADNELDELKEFVAGGGKILAMVDPVFNDKLANFKELFGLFKVGLGDNVLMEEDASRYYKQPSYILPQLIEIPLLIQPLIDKGLTPIMPVCRSLILPETLVEDKNAVLPLLLTSENAYAKAGGESIDTARAAGDPTGQFTIAAAAYIDKGEEADADAKLVIFGTSRFAAEAGLMQTQGNFSLVLNTVSWLLSSREAVAVPAKFIGSRSFIIPNETALILIIVFIFALPVLIIALGVRVYIKRKRL